ncbi:MAG TPA: DUF3352 domain-containing protein, partial [Stenomitos sp.]
MATGDKTRPMQERRAELEKKRQKKQLRSLAFTLGGAALLVGGGTLAYFLLNSRQSQTAVPLGATITPQNALLSLTVSTDRSPWQKLQGFGTAETQASWQKQLKGAETEFLEPFGANFDQDVRSWVGPQMTLTLLSPAAEDTATAKVGANTSVWFLPIRDLQRAQALLTRMGGNGGPQKRTYKDVEVQTFAGSNGKSVSAFILDNRLMVAANGNFTLNQVIDTYRGGPSLAQVPRLQEALGTIGNGSSFAQVYLNLPLATAGALQNAGRSLSQSTVERVQAVQGLSANVALDGDRLNLKAISWLKPTAKTELKTENKSQTLARLLPSDTLMATTGGDFRALWQDYSQGAETQLVVPLNPSKIQAGLLKSTGIDFEKDFVSWMGGEFVAAAIPTTTTAKQGVGLALLVQATDRTRANQSFQKLDDAMRDRYNFLVAESQVGNRKITTWKVPPNLPLASHGWLDNNVAFFTFGAPIADRIVKPASSTLEGADLFRATLNSSLNPNSGQFFVDLPRTISTMQNSPLLPKLAPSVAQLGQAIDAIGT